MRGIPIAPGQTLTLRSEAEHSLFLRCAELYRLIDILQRNTEHMVEAYSKFRTREPFGVALTMRYFPLDETRGPAIDPDTELRLTGAINELHELKLRLSYADGLPFAVKEDIEAEVAKLSRAWTEIRARLTDRLGWELAPIDS
jgi:hypothetical protein